MPGKKRKTTANPDASRYQQIVETTLSRIWMAGTDGTLSYVNTALAQSLGYAVEQMTGTALWEYLAEEEQAKQHWNDVLQGMSKQHECAFRHRDGQVLWMLVCANPLLDSAGNVTGLFGLCADITEHKQAALEQERRLAAQQARAEREALLNRIGQAVRAAHDPERVQQIAMQLLGHALNADRCYFSLYDLAADTRWIGEDYRRADLPPLTGRYRISDYAIRPQDYYTVGRTLILEDCETWNLPPPMAAALRTLRVRSLLAVPLFDDGALVATLAVAMADAPRVWTADEVALVEAVATLTRSAIESARIEKREREIAEQFQTALLPTVPPQMPGLSLASHYQPALEEARVGGDFMDVFSAADGTTVLVVGDVSGKGLEAAGQVGIVRPMLRFSLDHESSLAAAVTALNETLERHQLLRGFATLFAARYDRTAQRLVYVNCGQEPALVRRASGVGVEELRPTGPILGVISDARYVEYAISLAPGDTLAIFTDGLTDAGPRRTATLDVAGVTSLLGSPQDSETAADITRRLVTGADQYSQGGTRDDVCLLVAVVTPPSLSFRSTSLRPLPNGPG